MHIAFITTASSVETLDDEKQGLANGFTEAGHRVTLVHPKKMYYIIGHNSIQIYHRRDRIDTPDVFFCLSTLGRARAVGFLAEMWRRLNPNMVFWDGDRYMKSDTTKLFTSADRAYRGIGPKTFVAFDRIRGKRLADVMTYPSVVKPIDGRRGQGVQRIEDRTTMREFVEWFFPNGRDEDTEVEDDLDDDIPMMAQVFTPMKHEYRVYAINGRVVGTARKNKRDNPNTPEGFRRMVSWGGGVFIATAHERPKRFVEQHFADEPGLIGVDVVWGEDDKYYAIEVNRAPGAWTEFRTVTGIDIAQAVARSLSV
jgi:hypothetical protein